MVHQGERLAFGLESGHDLFGVHPQLDDFEGHAAAHGLLLLGHIDHPESAFPNLLENLEFPDLGAGTFGKRRYVNGSGLQEATGRFMRP